ncbi:MAG: dCMP deaminase family protein [Deltaproteobacteria bacterium]|jgi:dCMP deaminase|nr:dCMP deaminase family protein [Deltaproteobacteria bacterium]
MDKLTIPDNPEGPQDDPLMVPPENGQQGQPQGKPLVSAVGARLTPRPNWHEYFMAMAKVVSTRSTCSSRPVGCVITLGNRILVTGYNGAPPGAPHCTDQSRDGKLYCQRRANNVPDSGKLNFCPSVHAEENALALADRLGLSALLRGSTLYSTLSPCVRCIGNLVAHGVARVYYELAYRSVDRERDLEWERLARESFEVYEQVLIASPSLGKIASSLLEATSERLMPSE